MVQKPEPPRPGPPRRRFTRGGERPRGVAWYGARSFWGHLRHLAASAIATEDIDSRDWMTPDDPSELVARIATELGVRPARTLTESLGRDLYIDYLSDTGDDVSVSRAVARLVFAEYELPDPAEGGRPFTVPRGDILLFGGDTAYPVATADEIKSRVVVPFNQVLNELPNDRNRVLLGIPGNHDWYDGLDGFGRMFRRQFGSGGPRPGTIVAEQRKTRIDAYADFARQFVLGGHVRKPSTLDLIGYAPVQNASYFALHVCPGIGLLGVDRQLKEVDSRQSHFFQAWLNHHLGLSPWVLLPDPVRAFGEPSPTGVGMIQALGLTLSARPHLVVAGDIHHYRREADGPTLHVTSGGGGAFLHPAALGTRGRRADVEWPDAVQSRALLPTAPLRIALGRAGFLPHFAFGLLLAPAAELAVARRPSPHDWVALSWTALVIFVAYVLLGGVRRLGPALVALALVATLATAPLPFAAGHLIRELAHRAELHVPLFLLGAVPLTLAAFGGALVFGVYLTLLTVFGIEKMQAFTSLDHPGFKHFVRFRVRKDGSAIDGWCIGKVDPLSPDEAPVLVDAFTWKSRM